MLRPRVIVCLDVKDGRVVKGTQFKNLRDVGDPVELSVRYEREGADEIVFLDVSASREGRSTLLDTVRRTAETLFIPLTVGGGVRSADDIGPLLRAGADKISVNTAIVRDPTILSTGAERFGSQCVVATIEARAADRPEGSYTTRLLEDRNLRLKKLGEETAELVAALATGEVEQAVEEAADLIYHVLVALRAEGATLGDVAAELGRRAK